MNSQELSKLKIDKEEIDKIIGKWIAFYHSKPDDHNVLPIILSESNGSIAAYENLIDLQVQIPIIIQRENLSEAISEKFIKRHVHSRHVSEEI